MGEIIEVQAVYGEGKSSELHSFFASDQSCGVGSTKQLTVTSTYWMDVTKMHQLAVSLNCAAMASTTDEGKTLTVYMAGGIDKTHFDAGGNSTPYQCIASVSCRVAKGAATARTKIIDVQGFRYIKPICVKSNSATSAIAWSLSASRVIG
jgi:hypothetical protein